MRRGWYLVVGTMLACGASGPSEDRVLSTVTWPQAANTYDSATGIGCLPEWAFHICEVPDGSVIHPDGSITTPDGHNVASCTPACSAEQYSLDCRAPLDPGNLSPLRVPEPDPALRCTVVPTPTPPNVAHYCCPGI